LDSSNVGYETQGYFESIVRKQVDESSAQSTKPVYHRRTNMSNSAMTKFSLGKARLDPQRIVPSEMTTLRNHPSAITMLRFDKILIDKFEFSFFFRHEQGPNNEIVPSFTERLVVDRSLRGRLGPGG
jgi:hypothetical protein